MRLKTATYREIKKTQRANTITFKKSINVCQSVLWSSKKYGAEIPVSIVNGLLSLRTKKGTIFKGIHRKTINIS